MIPKLDEYKKQFHLASEQAIKPGLEPMKNALAKLGSPEKNLRIIHVSGTNGKGSTIAFMDAILRAHGLSTAVFSSPALYDIHDQIRLNGEPVTADELSAVFRQMKEAGISGMLTDFELLTAAAMLVFERANPDFVLLETGMGGLLDSTNTATPAVSVITSIALDHTGFLGGTIEEIARHKAGIIKQGVPVVTGVLPEAAMHIAEQTAAQHGSELYAYGRQFSMEKNGIERFTGEVEIALPERKLKGPHQAINCAVAIQALLAAGAALDAEKTAEAVAQASLPFRFQKIADNVYIDGAHNPAAARMLVQTVEEQFPGEKVNWVVGMLNTKEYGEVIDVLAPLANRFTFVDFGHPQAAKAEDLQAVCPVESTIIPFDEIKTNSSEESLKIIVGSLYLLSSLMRR